MATAITTDGRRAVPHGEPRTASGDDRFGYRPALDGVRGIAILAVIAYHYNYRWARGGFLGVDTFFVLSGFLITTLLVYEYRRRTSIRLPQFWARRARRLLPALFLTLLGVALYTYFVANAWDRPHIRADGFASLFYVANWRFIVDNQDYFSLFSPASPLRHMWTLAIEEQYYLLWPAVTLVCLRVARGSVRVLTAVCAVGIAVSIAAMALRYSSGNVASAYYATDARAHALLIGALLAVVFLARPRGVRQRGAASKVAVVAPVALLALFIGFATLSGTAPGYYHGASAFYALMSAIVVAGAMQPGFVSSVLSFRPLVWIGQISYGLYLWHWPITVWLVPSRVSLGPNELNALRLVVTFAVAGLSFYVVERPIRRRALPPRTALAAFVPAVLVVALVVFVSASDAGPAPSYLVGSPPPAAAVASGELPNYIWGYGDPLICGTPRADETAEARDAASRQPALALPASARDQRILLLGDSTACSLWPGLDAVGAVQGMSTDQGSVFGCGIAIDTFTSTRNEAVTPNNDRCRPFLDYVVPRALARSNPTVVVWMSVWEKSDLVVDGRTIVAGTPEWEAEVMARMDATLAQLTANGARVVMVTEAAPAPNPAQGTETFDRAADDAGYGRLNALLQRFAARHPDKVTLADLAAQLCPNGPPCPARVDGLQTRPDGRHFTPTSAVWAARFLLRQMFHAS